MAHWELLDEPTHALSIQYSFRPGSTARAFAVRFRDDELAVFSPPLGVPRAAYEELSEHGRVTALVAPNGFHWLGLAPALEVFPDAMLYAPDAALKRIAKRATSLRFQPLGELCERARGAVRILDVPGFSIGETWAVVDTANGPLWYVSDSCFNLPELPKQLAFRLFVKWTKSGPGLSFNGMANLVFLKDKTGYKKWFEAALAAPPHTLVPAHGDIIKDRDLGTQLGALLAQRL